MNCKKCNSTNLVKHGKVRSKQRWLCKDCGWKGVEHPNSVGKPQKSHPNHQCVNCGSPRLVKNGFNTVGNQLWKCKDCGYRSVSIQF